MKAINPYKMFRFSPLHDWLIERPEVSSSAKIVYARLAKFSGKNGKAFPKQTTLAKKVGLKERQVRNCLSELVEHKLLKAVRQGMGKPNYYLFLHHEWMEIFIADQERQDSADHEWQDSASPSIYKESHLNISTDDPFGPSGKLEGLCRKVPPEQWAKYFAYSEWFLSKQQETLGKLVTVNQASIKAGAKVLDNLIRVQGFDGETVRSTLEWGMKDSFWQDQLRSLGGLDKKSKSNGQSKFCNILTAYRRTLINAR